MKLFRSLLFAALVLTQLLLPLPGSCAQADDLASKLSQLPRSWVDSINEKQLVVDDMGYAVAKVKVYDAKGFLTDISSLYVGRSVVVERGEDQVSIYLITDGQDRAASTTEAKTEEPVIRQVDGVWKN